VTNFTPLSAIVGGLLIGIAAVLMYRLNGRIAGISGIVHGIQVRGSGDKGWRLLFVIGLIAGGWFYHLVSGATVSPESGFSLSLVVLAGVLVGAGTRLGSGCTSGHGVCGLARLSIRSLIATATFLIFGMATATFVHGLILS